MTLLESFLSKRAYQSLLQEKANRLKQKATATDWHSLVHTRTPHEKQQAFIESSAKRKVVRAGRRGGKTVGIAIKAVEEFKAGKRVLYAAPTEDQVQTFWYEVKHALNAAIDAGYLYKNETSHVIEVPDTKNRIRAKTAWNADTLRGDYADFLILDEFQLMAEDTWEVVGAPMLIDNNGDAVFIYTPISLASKSRSKARNPRHAAKLFKEAKSDTTGVWAVFHFTSYDNPFNPRDAIDLIASGMTTAARRQEIMAEDSEDTPGSLWTRTLLDKHRRTSYPKLVRVVIGVDPTGSSSNECGIIAAAKGEDGHWYVLDDASLLGTPGDWSSAVVSIYNRQQADRICGEVNYGGAMVEHTIRTAPGGNDVSYKNVNATRGKAVRAEPIAAQYERGRVHHIGEFPALEDELCNWIPDSGMKSPNRLDALVWALTELMPSSNFFMSSDPTDEP